MEELVAGPLPESSSRRVPRVKPAPAASLLDPRTTRRASARIAAAWLMIAAGGPGCAPSPSREVPPWLAAQVHVEREEEGSAVRLHVNMQMTGAAPDGLVTLPFVWREGQVSLGNVYVADATRSAVRRAATPVLDTGSAAAVALSRGGAARHRPWVSAEAGPAQALGAFGAAPRRSGVLGGLDLAAVSISPVPVSIGPGSPPLRLGMGLLSVFEGIIIDWPRRRLYLVVRRSLLAGDVPRSRERVEALAQRREWAEAELRVGAAAEAMEAARQVILSTADPLLYVEVQVAGRPVTALVDTGSTGDILVRRGIDWPLGPPRRAEAVDAAGTRRRVDERALRAPLILGRLRYDGVTVTTVWDDPAYAEEPFDAIIGLGVLRRAPLWLDWEAGVMRIWTGRAPLPDPGGVASP